MGLAGKRIPGGRIHKPTHQLLGCTTRGSKQGFVWEIRVTFGREGMAGICVEISTSWMI